MKAEGDKLIFNQLAKMQESGKLPIRCVADVMTRDVSSLTARHTFADAANLIATRHFRHFLVIEDARLVGVVSDRDVLRGLAGTDNWQGKEIREFMSVDPITVEPDTSLAAATSKMLSHRINCLPVVDANGNPCGILTSTDLLKCFETVLKSLQDYGCL